jgi:molybdate transport system substrate-binding protein
MVDQLAHSGKIVPASIRLLGDVHAGVAVRAGERAPAIGTRAELRASLAAATGICVPDPERATAGVHFLKVLRALGLHDTLAPRLRSYPNGAAAMRALAELPERGLVGCTQVTEITATSGVALVGPLPAPFDLATRYVAATCTGAFDPALAQQWVAMLSGESSRALRRDAGFVQ